MITIVRSSIVYWLVMGAGLLLIACSEAPIVPIQPTSRVVLAEVVFDDTT